MSNSPKQNRVTPFGEIIATSARGTLMGNRGCLHDNQGHIKRQYQVKRWIICQLNFKNRKRAIMTPGHYTELFFLDEATALAAGHRSCAECSRPRFNEFVSAWVAANPELASGMKISTDKLDDILHQERIASGRKVTYPERLTNLPPGTFITFGLMKQAYLVLEDELIAWHPEGYGQRMGRSNVQVVQVLTPRSVVQTLAYGYQVNIHPSVKKQNDY
ncbi:MAG: hypothetical protein KJ077_27695 [Anaerolineae bacterium]|nr:hypothetical protein [Anaerolineae bacterium]